MWRSAAAHLVSSGRRQASHSHDAAGAPRQLHDQPPAAAGPDALDGGLSLSAEEGQEQSFFFRNDINLKTWSMV